MANRGYMREVDSDIHILSQRLKDYVGVGMDNTIDVAQNIAEYCNEDENLKRATQDIMLNFIAMENDIENYVTALNHIKTVGGTSGGENLTEIFEEKVKELKQNGGDDLRSHAKYQEMDRSMSSTDNIEEQLDTLRERLTGGTGDEDVAMTQVEVNIKCPYTGQRMVKPVRNKVCGHVYDNEGILQYIQFRKAKAKCPVAGCGNKDPITVNTLEEHKEMEKYLTLLSKLNQ